MRILHVISGLGIGGAETVLKRLVESDLDAISNTVIVSLGSIGPIGQTLAERGFSVVALNLSPTGVNLPLVFFKLISILKYSKPDVVQTWMYHADFLGGVAARIVGIKNIFWGIHSTAIPQGRVSVTYWLVRLCALLSHFIPYRIVCCAHSARNAHIKLNYSEKKLIVVPNGYDFSVYHVNTEMRDHLRSYLNIDSADIVVGIVGRFDPLKDFSNFISAASYIVSRRNDVKFLMVGANLDWSNPTLCLWLEKFGLQSSFRLVGYKSNIPDYLSVMDIFCLSSVSEAFPNVVVEAMAIGLPCVVTQAGDAADILSDARFVVPVSDSVMLANALLRMCDLDPFSRKVLGEGNAKRVREKYCIEKICKDYKDVYMEFSIE